MKKTFLLVISTLIFPLFIIAQENSCPQIVRTALERVDNVCQQTGRNQACYGNGTLEAEFFPGSSGLRFDQPGDMADLMFLERLKLSPMDTEIGTWGVALMNLQANLPDTLPGQGVMFLLIGDVEVENAQATAPFEMIATGNVNLRNGPSTNDGIIGSLLNGEIVQATGRNEAGDWVLVQREDDLSGWVYLPLMTTEQDIHLLAIKESIDDPQQAYYFRTGLGDAQCSESPNSGILIQTPEGVGEVNLNMNGVQISLGSTAFLQARPDGDMNVNVLEGKARVAAFGEEQVARQNMVVHIPMDENLTPKGPPSPPKRCEVADVQALVEGLGDCEHIGINLDNQCPATVPYGMTIHISNGFGYYSLEEAQAAREPHIASIVVDGVTVADTVGPVEPHGPGMWGYGLNYTWHNPEPGVHIVQGPGPHGSHIGLGDTRTCEITILDP